MFTAFAPALATSATLPPLASFADVLRLRFEDVPKYDIGLLNLLCAEGLPRTEEMNIPKFMATLDAWAKWVKVKTEKAWTVFRAKKEELFGGSENFFRVYWMLKCLSDDFGVKYNPVTKGVKKVDWKETRDQFIHGIMGPQKTGTCATLPVVAVAVGRRLGYPLKLVHVPYHRFFRWDDGQGEVFNVEYSGDGSAMRLDAHYRVWPDRWDARSRKLEQCGVFLTSLSPVQELAEFIRDRAFVGGEYGCHENSVLLLDAAYRLDSSAIDPCVRRDWGHRWTGKSLPPFSRRQEWRTPVAWEAHPALRKTMEPIRKIQETQASFSPLTPEAPESLVDQFINRKFGKR